MGADSAGRPASGSSAAVAARGPVRRAAHATRTPRYISHDGIYDPNRRPAGHRHRGLHSEWLSLAPVDAAWPSAWLDAAAPRPRRTRLQMRRPGRGGRGITRCRAVTFSFFVIATQSSVAGAVSYGQAPEESNEQVAAVAASRFRILAGWHPTAHAHGRRARCVPALSLSRLLAFRPPRSWAC